MSTAPTLETLDNTGPSGESKPADSPIEIYRHSSAHLLAAAVTELHPEAQCGIGPPTEDGFFYDFLVSKPFTPEDLVAIEKRMAHIVKQNRPIEKKLLPKAEALALFASKGQTLKCELIQEKAGDIVQCYTMGEFIDFCLGPHLPSTGKIKAIKVLSSSGSLWKGKEGNPAMQRIHGTSFFTPEELDQHLMRLEEAKKRDHRKLGRELDLFSIADETGSGLILWHPKGGFIRKNIEDFWRDQHLAGGYDLVYSPHIAKIDLWNTSGHTQYYKANMYSPIDIEGVEYQLKPMNCPFHITIYKSKLRSYRELPLRYAELGTVYRFERSGVLHGLLRVRGFTQDDAHLFCRLDQIDAEIVRVLDFVTSMLKAFGFERYDIFVSTKPADASGTDEQWNVATAALKRALETRGLAYEVDPGEGTFYGPKIDIKIKDSLERAWQCSTIQVDFHNPNRFEPGVHRRRRQGAPAGDAAPCAPRKPRALLRGADRALRRGFPALARTRAGRGHSRGRAPSGVRELGGEDAARPRRTRPRGRPQREDGLQDPGSPDAEGPLHARGGGQGSRGR